MILISKMSQITDTDMLTLKFEGDKADKMIDYMKSNNNIIIPKAKQEPPPVSSVFSTLGTIGLLWVLIIIAIIIAIIVIITFVIVGNVKNTPDVIKLLGAMGTSSKPIVVT